MPRLIIGQVSDTEARIWVRGSKKLPVAFLRYGPAGATPTEKKIALEERHEFTSVFCLAALSPDTRYNFSVRYGASLSVPIAKRTRLTGLNLYVFHRADAQSRLAKSQAINARRQS